MVKKSPWYVSGLHFECQKCGRCCSGPAQGYIWVTRPEIEIIAGFLKISPAQLRQQYLRRVGLRITIIEQAVTKNCMFLHEINGQKLCVIYPVRPGQCRSWPFWLGNLACPDDWSRAAQKCPGINRGKHYSCDEIKKILKNKKWWLNSKQTASS